MSEETEIDELVEYIKASSKPTNKELARRTKLAPDAPAPYLERVIATQGLEPTTKAVEAWNARLAGHPIIDIAHDMGVSIELAKKLIGEVHTAIYEDLKSNVDLNRQLDLGRIDSIIRGHLPPAQAGDPDSANVVLRALSHRARLTGLEEPRDSTRDGSPRNVMIWLTNQLPAINKIVDALPPE
jgi:hypothetical protein